MTYRRLPSRLAGLRWLGVLTVAALAGACGGDGGMGSGSGSSSGEGSDTDPTAASMTNMTTTTVSSTSGSTTDDTTTDPSTETGVESSSGSESGTDGPGCATPVACADEAEAATAAAMEALRDDPDGLRDFLIAMPLGGDLHHHLSGAVYAEAYMGWADEIGGFCIADGSLSLSTACGDGNDSPIPSGLRDLHLEVVKAWSMFEFVPTQSESGADHFFATFGKFGAISGTEHGRMLADVRRRASAENVLYIEPMLTSNSTARALGEDVWAGLGGGSLLASDYPALLAGITADPGFANARARLEDDAQNSEQESEDELACATAAPKPGCEVVTMYQAYISRSGSDAGIFGQMVAAYEAAIVEPRIVGLNLVGPEDGSTAMANYDRLMAMLEYLNTQYEGVSPLRLSLHAGEITAASIPGGYQLDETQHIRKAVEVAGARRVGHGVDVMFENNPDGLLADLRDAEVLVEICFASNDIILEVSGDQHPVHDYLAAGVPVALATDDQGVARSSMAAEFYRGVVDQGLDYYELKSMVRASLEYSFLPGDSFWADYGALEADAACAPDAGDTPVTQPPSGACDGFLAESARARVQRDLQVRFEAFESAY